ncbi:gluconokinase [Sphingomonas oryzagri]
MSSAVEKDRIAPLAIVVMGVSGSGKSTLGALLAAQLHTMFLEGDSFHSEASVAKMRSGIPLTDDDRWPWLDRLGGAMAAAVVRDGLVIAACSALRRSYRDRLAIATATPIAFVLLDAAPPELARRLGNRPGHYMPASLLDSQLRTLERPSRDEPAIILDSSEAPDLLCEKVLEWLPRRMMESR